MNLVGLPAARPRRLVTALFVLGLALDGAEAWMSPGRWQGWLPSVVHSIEIFSQFGDVLVAVAAAWLAANARRWGLGEWGATSVRARTTQLGSVVAGAVLPVWAAHAIVGIVMAVLSVQRAGWVGTGWWVPLCLMTGPALSTLWAICGCALGLRLPRVVATSLAAVLPFATVAVLDVFLDGTPAAVMRYASSARYLAARPSDLTLAARLLATVALTAWLWARLGRCRTWVRSASATAASLTLAFAFLTGSTFTPISEAQRRSCEGQAPRICLAGTYEAARPTYAAMIRPVWQALPTPLRKPIIDATGADGATIIAAGPTDDADAVTLSPDRASSIAALGTAAWPVPQCELPAEEAVASLAFQVWWLHRFGIRTDGTGPLGTNLDLVPAYPQASRVADQLQRMGPAERDAWVVRHMAVGAACVATSSAAPYAS